MRSGRSRSDTSGLDPAEIWGVTVVPLLEKVTLAGLVWFAWWEEAAPKALRVWG